MPNKVYLYDTTLRDGAQAEDISFSVEDKVRIALKLDELGVHYIEGGWPGSNPKDIEFFAEMRKMRLASSTLVSFGSTRRAGVKAKDDPSIKALLSSGAPAITVVGKSWKFHVTHALRATLEENLDMIGDTMEYLKKRAGSVIFDAEHFFDGYKDDPEYSIKT
ncbi:MAG: citramalate synthase, partial [Deltaproteobacteria bacterium]